VEYLLWLVVSFNPLEKYDSQNGIISPTRDENKKYLKILQEINISHLGKRKIIDSNMPKIRGIC